MDIFHDNSTACLSQPLLGHSICPCDSTLSFQPSTSALRLRRFDLLYSWSLWHHPISNLIWTKVGTFRRQKIQGYLRAVYFLWSEINIWLKHKWLSTISFMHITSHKHMLFWFRKLSLHHKFLVEHVQWCRWYIIPRFPIVSSYMLDASWQRLKGGLGSSSSLVSASRSRVWVQQAMEGQHDCLFLKDWGHLPLPCFMSNSSIMNSTVRCWASRRLSLVWPCLLESSRKPWTFKLFTTSSQYGAVFVCISFWTAIWKALIETQQVKSSILWQNKDAREPQSHQLFYDVLWVMCQV